MSVSFVYSNSIEEHNIGNMVKPIISSTVRLIVQASTLIWCCYLVLRKAGSAKKLFFIFTCLIVIGCLCESFRYYDFPNNVQQFIVGFEVVVILSVYKLNNQNVRALIAITLLGSVPFIGSNVGVIKFVSLPLIPILYCLIRHYWVKSMMAVSVVSCTSLFLFSCFQIRQSSFWDVGIVEANYEITSGLAKGIKTWDKKGRLIDEVSTVLNRYNRYKNIVLRQDQMYIYEYLLQSRNRYLRHRFNGADDNDTEYVSWVESQINKGGDKVAVWRFGDCNEPSLMTDALNKHCTKVKVTDDYTIYIKKPESHE